MRISRRIFIKSTSLAAAAPALASLFAVSRVRASPTTSPQHDLVFKIDGWSARDFVSTDDSPPAEELWISVNHSWRTAWR